jgi:hypothetical protein
LLEQFEAIVEGAADLITPALVTLLAAVDPFAMLVLK